MQTVAVHQAKKRTRAFRRGPPAAQGWRMWLAIAVMAVGFAGASAAVLLYTSYSGLGDANFIAYWRVPAYVNVVVSSMAVAGGTLLVQHLIRNPTADIGFIGIGAVDVIVFTLGLVFVPLGQFALFNATLLPVFYVLAGVTVVALYVFFVWRRGRASGQLLVMGALVTVVASAFASFATQFLPVNSLLTVVNKRSAGFVETNLNVFLTPATYVAFGLFGVAAAGMLGGWKWVVMVGSDEVRAKSLGVPVRLIYILEALGAVMFATSGFLLVGNMVFIGFVACHVAQTLFGGSSRKAAVYGMFFAATSMLLIHFFNTNLFAWNIPLGIIAALVAAPYLVSVFLFRRMWSKAAMEAAHAH